MIENNISYLQAIKSQIDGANKELPSCDAVDTEWQCFFALDDLAGSTELTGLLYVNTRPDFVRVQLYYEA